MKNKIKKRIVHIAVGIIAFLVIVFPVKSWAYSCKTISCAGLTGSDYQSCAVVQNLCSLLKDNNCDEMDCSGLSGDDKDKCGKKRDDCEELDEKADKYFKLWELTQKQKNTLNGQINSLNGEINKISGEIGKSQQEIDELNQDVGKLESKIEQKEKVIESQKKLLSEIVRNYYENSSSGFIFDFIGSSGLSGVLKQQDYLGQTSKKIQELLGGIKELQQAMKDEVIEIEEKKDEVEEELNKLAERNKSLQSTKTQKRSLLIQTQGDEAKYQEKLKKVEAQKQELLGDIDELYNANYAELDKLAIGLPRPSSGLASTSWYYSQKDSRWKDDYIGNSKSKMKDYGCAISAVAMVLSYHGDNIKPDSLCKKPIFYWDLISWPSSSSVVGLSGKVDLKRNTNHSGVDWDDIDDELDDGNPVIVFIGAKGKAGHYVVIHGKDKKGKYVVHDPYFGPNIYLESTMKLLSKLYSVSISDKSIDQMILYR